MNQVPIHNTGNTNRYIGGVCIPPGETRMIDARLLPPEPPDEPAPPAADPIGDLLKLSVKEIVADLGEFDDETLARIEARELADETPRKTLLDAIAQERLKRADAAAETVA
jgi:hypothetical protein